MSYSCMYMAAEWGVICLVSGLTTVVGEPARLQVEGWADVEDMRVGALLHVWNAQLGPA